MSTTCASTLELTLNDTRLMEEALRRARASRFNVTLDPGCIEEAIVAELSRGTRDMHSLMRAVSQLSNQDFSAT